MTIALLRQTRQGRPRPCRRVFPTSIELGLLTATPGASHKFAAARRASHDETGALEIPDEPLRDDVRHECVRVVLALPALELQREGERCGKFVGVGRREFFVGVGHPQTIAQVWERSKNEGRVGFLVLASVAPSRHAPKGNPAPMGVRREAVVNALAGGQASRP